MELKKEYSCLEKNELVFIKSINVDKNYQETPEAYLDDIFKVVKCISHSYVTSCDIKDSTVFVTGKTEICLTYYNKDSELIYTDFVEDFSENIAIDEVSEYAFGIATVNNKYCNFRIINQRRIDVHASFALNICIYDKKSCPCVYKCNSSKLKLVEEKIACVENAIISKIDIEESFALPSNSNGIKRVVSFETSVLTTETTIIKDKALIKATVLLSVLYSDNDNRLDRAEYTFEASKIVEIIGVDEKCSCIVKICNGCIYIKAKSSSDDNGGKIELYGDLSMTVVVVKEENKKIVSDGYILSHNAHNRYSYFNCITDGKYTCKESNAKLSVDLSSRVNKILDFCVKVAQCTFKSKKLCVEFEICALIENDENCVEYIAQNKVVEIAVDSTDVASNATVSSFDYAIVNDKNISVNVIYIIYTYSGKAKKISVLTEMECDDEMVSYPALTVYFAKQNERLWDIAKQFSSDAELIKKENNITCESLDTNKVIIIPGL